MPSVKTFVIGGKHADVEDSTARTTASNTQKQATSLSVEVDNIKKLSRLTATYAEATSTITITTETHNV